ncbi:hypothetical protein NE237_009986 [Protea cynaroides]|uniref:Uncharacterized protein n=1 Tax=Protea cynaroides TaxID=273540 RepID=A0A9Q0KZP5_9MAGN|nr:hypothetical protein NE237_009986 [Protea cynaroides]
MSGGTCRIPIENAVKLGSGVTSATMFLDQDCNRRDVSFSENSHDLSNKLWLSSKIPPPPPPQSEEETADAQQAKEDEEPNVTDDSDSGLLSSSEKRNKKIPFSNRVGGTN